MSRTPIVAGNWKMHGSRASNNDLLNSLATLLDDSSASEQASEQAAEQAAEILVFPPYVYLESVCSLISELNCNIQFGAQNLSQETIGAFTGEVSMAMLNDLRCTHVLVGHSERRSLYNEDDELVACKFATALEGGLIPILCVGESLAERNAGITMDIVLQQINAIIEKSGINGLNLGIIAYEPVWAIGTGETASPQQAQDVHHAIRQHLGSLDQTVATEVRILYGGSVNGNNAEELFSMKDIDGGLVGGASLNANEFYKICKAAG